MSFSFIYGMYKTQLFIKTYMFAEMLQIKDFPHQLFLFSFIENISEQTVNTKIQSLNDIVYIKLQDDSIFLHNQPPKQLCFCLQQKYLKHF